MKKGQKRQLTVSLLSAGAVFLVLALLLRWNFVLSAVLAVGVYVGLFLLLTPRPEPGTMFYAARPDGEQLAAWMEEAGRDLAQVALAAGQITDAEIQCAAVELAGTGEHIYRYLREQPDKIPAARRFLTYYLDTVGRILIQYVKFQEAGLRTEEVLGFQDKVRTVLPKLRAGFEEQLSQLMAAERFDAEADMQVLERLLDTEGFSCGEKRS